VSQNFLTAGLNSVSLNFNGIQLCVDMDRILFDRICHILCIEK
jgi:hypothetical protein